MTRRTALKLMGSAGAAAISGLIGLSSCKTNSNVEQTKTEKKSYSIKRIVFFFTGTGNCLYVAKNLSDNPISIPQAMKKNEFNYEADEIGIVYPIYGQLPPNMVYEFLKKAKLSCNYLFAVATYGNTKGGSVEIFDKMTKDINLQFNYIATLLMVDNWLPKFDMNEQVKIDKKVDENLAKIKADLETQKQYIEPVTEEEHQKALAVAQRTSGPFRADHIEAKAEEWFTITDRCITCGLCMRVCPRANYKFDGEKATASGTCELCLACVLACPHKAIIITSGEANPNARYRHPSIKSSEIQRANNQLNPKG